MLIFLEGKVISYKSLVIEWCQKRHFIMIFFEDNAIDGQRLWVKLSIDNKVIAKARATSKKRKQNRNALILRFKKMDKIMLNY
jgi:ribonuclease-3